MNQFLLEIAINSTYIVTGIIACFSCGLALWTVFFE